MLDYTPLPAGCRYTVLFVYPNAQRVRTPQLGIASLSACVKRIGGRTSLFDATIVGPGTEPEAFAKQIEACRPDMLAFSVRSNEWPLARKLIEVARRFGVLTVIGGPHATYAPEEAIREADVVVVGEGEGAMMDLVRALATGRDYADIPNIWCRRDGHLVANVRRDLIPNLDDLPLPDWRLFDDVHYYGSYLRNVKESIEVVAAIEGSRGCPFTCTYCSNERLMRDYRGHGAWRREKSARRMVEELAAFRREYGKLDFVYWSDEIWLTRTARLTEFRDLYKKAIGAPFSIMERPECITEEKIRIAADAGLFCIAIGLESGDEKLRQELLHRRTPHDVLVRAFTLPKKHGVKVHAFTMLGLPGQDERSMMRTWDFMREVRPDTAQFSIFYPLKGTVLYDQTVAAGLHDPSREMTDYYSGSPLKQPGIDNARIEKFQRLFEAYAAKPGILPAIKFHLARRSDGIEGLFFFLMRARMAVGRWRRSLRARLGRVSDRAVLAFRPRVQGDAASTL